MEVNHLLAAPIAQTTNMVRSLSLTPFSMRVRMRWSTFFRMVTVC